MNVTAAGRAEVPLRPAPPMGTPDATRVRRLLLPGAAEAGHDVAGAVRGRMRRHGAGWPGADGVLLPVHRPRLPELPQVLLLPARAAYPGHGGREQLHASG